MYLPLALEVTKDCLLFFLVFMAENIALAPMPQALALISPLTLFVWVYKCCDKHI